MQAMSLIFALAQKENTSFTVDMRVIFHINDILWNILQRVYLTTRSTVTSACQGSGLACTRTISIFRTLTYMQTRFRHQNKQFCIGMK